MKKYVVARAAEVPDGGRLLVEVRGHSIGVFHVGDEYYALLNRCPHQGAELCKGSVVGLLDSSGPGDYDLDESRSFIVCPWHGWEFELATGQSYFDPRRTRVKPYPVTVERGGRVKGPYVADVIEVSVEDDYLVLTLPG